MPQTLVYQPNPAGRWLPVVGLVIAALGSIALLVVALVAADAPATSTALAVFALYWTVLAWLAYWFLVRISYRVTFDGTSIAWATPLQGGDVDLQLVEAVRPWRLAGVRIGFVDLEIGRPVLIVAAKGLVEFTDAIARARPDLEVELGRVTRLVERLPGSSRLQRR